MKHAVLKYKIDEEDKKILELRKLEQERNSCLQNIHGLQAKVFSINERIEVLKKKREEEKLSVSDHAIQRFKERVCDISSSKIRSMLTSNELTKAYIKHGSGKYGIKELPTVFIIIKDFVVVTVINKNNPEEKLQVLSEYMNYYVDKKVQIALGESVYVMNFKQFRNHYYQTELLN